MTLRAFITRLRQPNFLVRSTGGIECCTGVFQYGGQTPFRWIRVDVDMNGHRIHPLGGTHFQRLANKAAVRLGISTDPNHNAIRMPFFCPGIRSLEHGGIFLGIHPKIRFILDLERRNGLPIMAR